MKKTLLIITAILVLVSTAACGDPGYSYYNYDLAKYVEIGEFNGIEVAESEVKPTEQDILDAVHELLIDGGYVTESEITDRTVEKNDTVNIDYEGLKDGVAFEGGTAEGASLTIGSGRFIEGFEDGLIGAAIGETRALNLTFPENYPSNPDLAGVAVVFNVTINSISGYVYPEITDELVAQLGDYTSAEQYLNEISSLLEKENKYTLVQDRIVSSANIIKYPKDEVQEIKDDVMSNYEGYASQYSMTVESLISTYMGMDMDTFNEQLDASAKNEVKIRMVCVAIARRENITISDDEFNEFLTMYTENQGYESEDACLKANGKNNITVLALVEKVFNTAIDGLVIK